MAKSTKHKAFASIGFKLTELQSNYNNLRSWFEHAREETMALRAALKTMVRARDLFQGLLQTERTSHANTQRRLNNKDVEMKNLQMQFDTLSHRTLEELGGVPRGLHKAVQQSQIEGAVEVARLSKVLVQVENRAAKIADEARSTKQSAVIYGVLSTVASYGLGIAMQHFFPITF